MSIDFARCIPILPSPDITETRDFYVGKLGFAATWGDDNYLIVRRDDMEIQFHKAGDRRYADHPSCYIRGGEVPALYEEYSRRGVPGLSSFEVRPWNMKEFHLRDPHGNLLRFGCGEW